MADNTPLLGLPYILAAQAQKHVTHNEALRLLDGIVQLSVKDRNLNTPPGAPADGDRYLVAAGASGAWNGWSGDIAMFADGTWWRLVARPGWLCWVEDEGVLLARGASSWSVISGSSFSLFGVNTTADTTNRLAVKSDAVLFSHDDVTPGSGDIHAKLNKSGAAKDAGFIFQSNWSTRALFGLLGSDDFTLKVSPDGSNFKDALVVDDQSGQVSLPQAPKFSAYMNWNAPNFPVTADGWAKVPFNNAVHNDYSAFDAVDSSFVAPAAGYYQFGAYFVAESETASTSEIMAGLSIDFDVPAANRRVITVAEAGKKCAVHVSGLLKLTAGQKVYVLTYFTGDDGEILDNENYFWGHRVA